MKPAVRNVLAGVGTCVALSCMGAFGRLAYKVVDAIHTPLFVEVANGTSSPLRVRRLEPQLRRYPIAPIP